MAFASVLEDRAIIGIAGGDTRNFLLGLITNDIETSGSGQALYAALLTPQGKILFEFFVIEAAENQYLLDCFALRAPDLVKRLTMYRLRAKVDIAPRPDLTVAALWGEDATNPGTADNLIVFPDPRHPALGLRAIGTRHALTALTGSATAGDYQTHRLVLGVPDSADIPPDQVFALDAGMEELNGVSFKKGCYVGQEVTARMKHRATARKRFVEVEIDGDLPDVGSPVVSAGREIGTVATGKEGRALALVRLDRLSEAIEKGEPITAAGKPVTLRKPEWFRE